MSKVPVRTVLVWRLKSWDTPPQPALCDNDTFMHAILHWYNSNDVVMFTWRWAAAV